MNKINILVVKSTIIEGKQGYGNLVFGIVSG
jgi:hypothetical protein